MFYVIKSVFIQGTFSATLGWLLLDILGGKCYGSKM